MPEISESVIIRWDAEQPAQVARTLLASVNELDMALGKLGSQTAAAFASGMQTHLSSVREQVTGLRLEFERLGIVMGQSGRVQPGAGGFPSPITAPLGTALPTATNYWGDQPLPPGFTPGVGGGDRPFSPGFGGNWMSAGAGYLYDPSSGRYRGPTGRYVSAAEVSEAIQGFQYGGRGQPGTLPVGAGPAPSLFDEEAQAAFYAQYGAERAGVRRFGRLFGEQAPAAYYGTQGYERQYGFEAGIGGMRAQAQAEQSQMAVAGRGVGRQDYEAWRQQQIFATPESLRAYQEAQRAIRGVKEEMRGAGEETDALTGRFTRHLTWILQGILIWESFRIVGTIIREVAGEFIALEAASARVAYITGQVGARGAVLGQVVQGAQYGIQPSVTEQGAILAAQAGATSQQMEQARQIAFVFGTKEYSNALSELAQTQRTASAFGLEHVNVTGYLARAMKEVPVDQSRNALEQYMDALQQGVTLYKDLGLTAEQSGLVVGRVAYAIEGSGTQAANVIQTIINNLRRPERREALAGFGITAEGIPEQLRQASAALQQLINAGQDQRAQELVALLAGGTINVQRIREAPLVFAELANAIRESGGELGNWNLLMGTVGDTTERRIDQMTAAWSTFLVALGQTSTVTGIFENLNNAITGITGTLQAFSGNVAGQSRWNQLTPEQQQQYIQFFEKQTGAVMTPGGQVSTPGLGTLGQAFSETWAREGQGRGVEPYTPPGFVGRLLRTLIGTGIGSVEGTQQAFYTGLESYFPEEAAGPSQAALLRGGRGGTGFAQQWGAIQARQNQPFGGAWNFQDLPKDVTFETLRTAIDKWDKILSQVSPEYTEKYGAPGGERREQTLTYFRDPLTNIFDKSISSQEALRMALEELTKIERAKIIGVWNVPAGMDFMLPFAALLGNTGIPGGGVGGGGGGGAGTGAAGGRGQPSVSALQYLMGGRPGPTEDRRGEEIVRQFLEANPTGGTMRQSYLPGGSVIPSQPRVPSRYERDEQFRRHNTDQMQAGNITINNRIIVQIDGRVVSTQLNRQLHMQNFGRNMVGGNPSSLLTE